MIKQNESPTSQIHLTFRTLKHLPHGSLIEIGPTCIILSISMLHLFGFGIELMANQDLAQQGNPFLLAEATVFKATFIILFRSHMAQCLDSRLCVD